MELARAVQVANDNAAANLLLARLGGSPALTASWRALGDPSSRLEGMETALNRVAPGEVHDTAQPSDMTRTVAKLLFGDGLPLSAQESLRGWMRQTATGLNHMRAAMPGGCEAGDNTSTGLPAEIAGTYVDLAYSVPPGTAPLVIGAWYNPPLAGTAVDLAAEAVLAWVGRIAVEELA